MDEMQLLRDLGFRVQPVSAAETATARRRLEAAISLEAASASPNGIRRRRVLRRSGARTGVVWGSAAASAVALIALMTLGPSPASSRAHAAAVEALTAAGDAAAAAPDSAEQGAYRYSKSRTANLVTFLDDEPYSLLIHATREVWIASDGSGYIREVTEQPQFMGERDRRRWIAAGQPTVGPGADLKRFGQGELYYEDLSGLPTDPDDLYEVVSERARGSENSHDAEMLTIIGDLLHETVAPPELRQALYEVAARIPSIKLVGPTTDSAGRTGTVVAITSDDSGSLTRTELVFDEETSKLLGKRHVLLERVAWVDHEPPTIVASTLYLSGNVSSSPPTSASDVAGSRET